MEDIIVPFTETLSCLLSDVMALRGEVISKADERLERYAHYYPDGIITDSARNLAHYLALRGRDLRPLQARLSACGLSSLGRGEPHVLVNIDRVIALLEHAQGPVSASISRHVAKLIAYDGSKTLELHTEALFGQTPDERGVRIMVTLPAEAAEDARLVKALINNGMDCARINCAHDDTAAWKRMVDNVRKVAEHEGCACRILMDLAGHKIRTGPIEPAPAVMHIRPERDIYGKVVAPAIIHLVCAGAMIIRPELDAAATVYHLELPELWSNCLAPNCRLYFTDARGKRRHFDIVERDNNGMWVAHCKKSAYFTADTALVLENRTGHGKRSILGCFTPGTFPGDPLEIRVHQGDRLVLTKDARPGHPAIYNDLGELVRHAHISCTLPEVVEQLRHGVAVWIDDGKIGAVVEDVTEEGVLLRVTHAGPKGARIAAEKGLNFPDTELNLPPLSAKDQEDLDFVCRHADMVGFSFVETLGDMDCLIDALKVRGAGHLPIVAKIETKRAVSNLPELLLGTIGRHPMGVMIARGDLAVELGNVRLAEIQEEILWLCEAGHVPVIWATQVLETIAKKGIRSRPEFTDAAMGVRAECVMLNKGPYILQALRALNNLLVKMQAHQRKKTSQLRALHW